MLGWAVLALFAAACLGTLALSNGETVGALWIVSAAVSVFCIGYRFHALIASGTTPKMIANEREIPAIGYGGMLMEAFVAVMALIAACVLDLSLIHI